MSTTLAPLLALALLGCGDRADRTSELAWVVPADPVLQETGWPELPEPSTEDSATPGTGDTGGFVAELTFDDADAVFLGEEDYDIAGSRVALLGDVSGDGIGDIGVGAPNNDRGFEGAGAAYVLFGPFAGTYDLGQAQLILSGPSEGAALGAGIAGGDVNGDGLGDFVATAVSSVAESYIFHHPVQPGATLADADQIVAVPGAPEAVLISPDQDADGINELVLGCYCNVVSIVELTSDPLLTAVEAEIVDDEYDHLGTVTRLGDLDGDGLTEFMLGDDLDKESAHHAGAVSIFYAPLQGTILGSDAPVKLLGDAQWDHAGQALASGFDADGDGLDDLLVGAPQSLLTGLPGHAYLVTSVPAGTALVGDAAVARFEANEIQDAVGFYVEGAGDLDDDGASELWVGAPHLGGGYAPPHTYGQAFLLSGDQAGVVDLNVEYLMRVEGNNPGEWAGVHMNSNYDQDGDGRPDVLFGSSSNDRGGTGAGAAFLFLLPGLEP